MKNWIGAALAAALLLTGGALAYAQDDAGPGGPDGPRPEMAARMKARLGLTDDQAAKLKSAVEAHRDAVKPLLRAERDAMTKLRDQIEDKASDDQVQATLDSLKATRKQLEGEQAKFDEALAGFLTPTQRAKMLVGMMARMRRRMSGLRGRPGRGGPGMKDGGAPPPQGDDGGKPGDKDEDGD